MVLNSPVARWLGMYNVHWYGCWLWAHTSKPGSLVSNHGFLVTISKLFNLSVHWFPCVCARMCLCVCVCMYPARLCKTCMWYHKRAFDMFYASPLVLCRAVFGTWSSWCGCLLLVSSCCLAQSELSRNSSSYFYTPLGVREAECSYFLVYWGVGTLFSRHSCSFWCLAFIFSLFAGLPDGFSHTSSVPVYCPHC